MGITPGNYGAHQAHPGHQGERQLELYDSCMATHERIAVIHTIVSRLERRLFGNGQPGEVDVLRSRVENVEKSHWKLAGAVGAIVILSKILLDWGVPLLTAAHKTVGK